MGCIHNKRLIFLDVDGTIYGPDRVVHHELKLKINTAIENDTILVIATGNAPSEYIKKLAKELNITHIIHSNGAGVINVMDNKVLYKKMIDLATGDKLLQLANKLEVHSDWWGDENISCNKFYIKDIKRSLEKNTFLNNREVHTLNEIEFPIYKIEFYDKDIIKMEELQLKLEEYENIFVSRTSPFHIEVTGRGVTKKTGLEFICNLYSANPRYIMAIGDSKNDESMLKFAGFSYSMGNAENEVKEWTNFSTLSYEENGLGIAIEHYLKIFKKE